MPKRGRNRTEQRDVDSLEDRVQCRYRTFSTANVDSSGSSSMSRGCSNKAHHGASRRSTSSAHKLSRLYFLGT